MVKKPVRKPGFLPTSHTGHPVNLGGGVPLHPSKGPGTRRNPARRVQDAPVKGGRGKRGWLTPKKEEQVKRPPTKRRSSGVKKSLLFGGPFKETGFKVRRQLRRRRLARRLTRGYSEFGGGEIPFELESETLRHQKMGIGSSRIPSVFTGKKKGRKRGRGKPTTKLTRKSAPGPSQRGKAKNLTRAQLEKNNFPEVEVEKKKKSPQKKMPGLTQSESGMSQRDFVTYSEEKRLHQIAREKEKRLRRKLQKKKKAKKKRK